MFSHCHSTWRMPMNAVMMRRSIVAHSTKTSRWLTTSSKEKLFEKILIANRGEIAVRVHRTCRRLGIKTVQVYSEPDVNSVAVRMADEAVCVGPAPSNQSYLSIPKIIAAVQATGAQAVHPGYGFLSENKDFCEALEKIGVTFIGPGHEAIHAMGDKIESKRIAKEAQVNTIPGFLGVIETAEDAVRVAQEITYPVMIKASAGGGGKGMRIAYNDDEVRLGFRLSKEEAASSFGDDRMFIEKFIEDPRHIEIQLIADQFGNVVPLPERECSIQRRNQKVIEEAPSVLLDSETRLAMGKQASMLAKKVGYVSAGTVEFLCDKHKNFYFLEMNTRLQVEHPVTEMISGVDLVEQMIRVAAGHALPGHLLRGPVPINGWAMESRVYAEDPVRGFLPSIGRLLQYHEPTEQPGVRIDSGVTEGSDISMFYDPLISKLITHGKDRKEALERMKVALDNYVIRGPGNNISFLQDVYRHPRFEKGEITTKFIAEEYPDGFERVQLKPNEIEDMIMVGAIMHAQKAVLSRLSATQTLVPDVNEEELEWICTNSIPGFKILTSSTSNEELIALAKRNHVEEYGEQLFVSTEGPFGQATPVKLLTFHIVPNHGPHRSQVRYMIHMNNEWNVISDIDWRVNSPLFSAKIRNQPVASQVMKVLPEGFSIQLHGAIHDVIIRTPMEQSYSQHMKPKPQVDTSSFLLCPMPGMLISVAVKEGDVVEIGQELCVVEAMKMQNVLRSEKKGKIQKIHHQAGDSLKVDEMILEYE